MSTATTYAPRVADHARDARPSLARLTRVELRKMYDTRAGFWLLLSTALIGALAAGLTVLTGHDSDQNFSTALDITSQLMNFLLPIVGILLVTSEWSQRTAQVTFTLVPQRGRVLLAKIGASIMLALAAFALSIALSALFTAIGGQSSGGESAWSVDGSLLVQTALFDLISLLIGVAFGAAILLSAPAIVASFVLPIAFSAVTNLIGGLEGVANWLDTGSTLPPMTDRALDGTEWAQVLTTCALWLVVPLAIGAYRFLRGEIR